MAVCAMGGLWLAVWGLGERENVIEKYIESPAQNVCLRKRKEKEKQRKEKEKQRLRRINSTGRKKNED